MDPKEKKAIILFFAILLLIIAYIYTHQLPWDSTLPDPRTQYPSKSSTDGYY